MHDDWVVYTREGCGLCEEFAVQLADLLGSAAGRVRLVDIEHDPELLRKYAERIPVLVIGGDFVCAYRLDVDRVRRYL